MMTCREFVEFMMAYDEGELSETELDLFEQHLAASPTSRPTPRPLVTARSAGTPRAPFPKRPPSSWSARSWPPARASRETLPAHFR